MTHAARVVAVAVLVALVLCAPAQAQTPEIDALRVRAEAGDAEAQYSLGFRYGDGRGVPEDEAVRRCVWHRIETWDFRGDSVKFELSRVEK
jgi:TPR repeat protein